MFNRYLTYYKPSVQLLSFFMLMLLSFLFVFGIDSLLIPWLADGMTVEEFNALDLQKNAEYISIKRIEQLMAQLVIFLIPALVFAYLAFPKPLQYLKIKTPLNKKHLLLGIGLILFSIPLLGFLEYANKMIPLTEGMIEIEEAAKKSIETILTTSDWRTIVINFLLFAIIPAIGEELFFRGVFQNVLLSSKTLKGQPIFAILIAAAFFSLMHMQMAGFIPRFYAGFLLGLAYYLSNNILVPIIMHAVHNAFALAMFYIDKSEFDNPIGHLDYKDLLEIIPLTILSLFLIYYFYKKKATYTIDDVEIDPDETHFLANYK